MQCTQDSCGTGQPDCQNQGVQSTQEEETQQTGCHQIGCQSNVQAAEDAGGGVSSKGSQVSSQQRAGGVFANVFGTAGASGSAKGRASQNVTFNVTLFSLRNGGTSIYSV